MAWWSAVQQRLPSLLDPPIMFAHRGARVQARENTIEAFDLALRLGATGLESDVWVTADGVAVLDHDGVVRNGLRRRSIRTMHARDLPEWMPTLEECFDRIPAGLDVSLDLKSPDAGAAVIDVLTGRSPERARHTWLCHPSVEALVAVREVGGSVRLMNSTRLATIREGLERRAADVAGHGLDGIVFHHTDWSGGLAALCHRFELVAFSWDLQFEHTLRPALRMGIDGVISDHVDRMVDAFAAEIGSPTA